MTLEHLAPHTYGDMDNYGIVKSKASLIIDGVGRIYKVCLIRYTSNK
ncbi:MAG: hypothetical protein ACLR43_11365 [Faecalibacillus faecis]